MTPWGNVEATVHVATQIPDRAPAVWARCLRNRDKHAVADTLQSGHPVRFIERFGVASPRSFISVYAGANRKNKNAMGFLDLDASKAAEIVDADGKALTDAVPGTPKLIRSVSINKTPNIFPITNPEPHHVAAARIIAGRPDFQERVGQAMADRFEDVEEPEEVERQIYGWLYSAEDKCLLSEFERSGWKYRFELVTQSGDYRLKQLGQRLIFWNAPALLSEHHIAAAQAALRDRWLSNDPDAPWTTFRKVGEQLAEIETGEVIDQDQLSSQQAPYQAKIKQVSHWK